MNNSKTNKTQLVADWAIELMKANPILSKKLDKLSIDEHITSEALFIEVIKFLYLASSTKAVLAPSQNVDLGWHEFILFTRTYEHFCKTKLGRFIHHTPDDNKKNNHRNFLKTLQHYIHHFGQPPSIIWGELAESEWQDSQCGSCMGN